MAVLAARMHPYLLCGLLLSLLGLSACKPQADTPPPASTPAASEPAPAPIADEARQIAQEAYIYGFPMVDNYRIQYSYFVDKTSPEYKGVWNQIHNTARVYTPDDKAIQTPNSDTPYSQLGADLRAEPLVISVPKVEARRYYSAQFIDMYTQNFAYVGSRATGNEAGDFLLAGPDWQGEAPKGIKAVLRSETQFAFVLFRTQLFNAADIANVKKIQAGYRVQPLSKFLGTAPPPPAPEIQFMPPLTPEQQKTSPEFFRLLNFVMQFCPTVPSETTLRERFAKIGIGPGLPLDVAALPAERLAALEGGMADAWKTFNDFKTTQIDTGKRTSAEAFGTREDLHGDTLSRMSGAVLGIYGNTKQEAMYPAYFTDDSGAKLDGSQHAYTLRFAPGQEPPAQAFWSATMYELPSSLLSKNSLNRYLINSTMLDSLKRDADGGITLYIQHSAPAADKQSNWLPAPNGPFFVAMRLYWPKARGAGRTLESTAHAGAGPPHIRQDPGSRPMKTIPVCRTAVLSAAMLVALGACQQSGDAPPPGEPAATPAPAPASTAVPAEPAAPADTVPTPPAPGSEVVTVDNFVRAETDAYFANIVKQEGFGKFFHNREPTPLDKQTVIRMNRDTLYSAAVFDLDAGPVTITLPDAGKRFVSMQVINQDQYTPQVIYTAGAHTLTRQKVGTRYVATALRMLADPNNPEDMKQVHALQDAVQVKQASVGAFETPTWDPASHKRIRDALLVLAQSLPDTRRSFGTAAEVDPIHWLVNAAAAWGGNPDKDAMYLNVTPARNDGTQVYTLQVKEVPVDAFWSISVYGKDGYFHANPQNAYSLNNLTAKHNDDGSVTVQFGGCDAQVVNCIPITPGWNYLVRLYRPRAELLNGKWTFPEATPRG